MDTAMKNKDDSFITSTPYDDVFKTMVIEQKELLIPLLNETFHTQYDGSAEIILSSNEHISSSADGTQKTFFSDSTFRVLSKGTSTLYHYECQSTPDHTMAVRFFQYDSQIAIENSSYEDEILHITFPYSAALYLRSNTKTADAFTIRLSIPDYQKNIEYLIPILKLKNYNIYEIFEKKLYFFIPFYIFIHESELAICEVNAERKELLFQKFLFISNELDKLVDSGELSLYQRTVIMELSRKVVTNLASKYENIREGVVDIMGGKVLELETKKNYLKGKEEGKAEGRAEGKAEGRAEGKLEKDCSFVCMIMKKMNFSLDEAFDFVEIDPSLRPVIREKINGINS